MPILFARGRSSTSYMFALSLNIAGKPLSPMTVPYKRVLIYTDAALTTFGKFIRSGHLISF